MVGIGEKSKNINILTPVPKVVNPPNLRQSFKFWKEMYDYSKGLGYNLKFIFVIQEGSNSFSAISKLKVPKHLMVIPYKYIENRFIDIAISRNILLDYVIEHQPQPDYILFLDSDLAPPKDALEKFVTLDKDICGGVVMTFNNAGNIMFNFGQWTGNSAKDFVSFPSVPSEKLYEVGYLDTACMFLTKPIYTKYKFCEDLPSDIDETHEFCHRVNKDHRIYLDTSVQCWHFRGEFILGVTPPPNYKRKIRNSQEVYEM